MAAGLNTAASLDQDDLERQKLVPSNGLANSDGDANKSKRGARRATSASSLRSVAAAAAGAAAAEIATESKLRLRMRSALATGILVIFFALLTLFIARFDQKGRSLTSRALVIRAQHGVVATDHEICSNMGVDILKSGGNAVDAAIVAGLCIGSVNIDASGIGGGGFMTVSLANGTSTVIDFRETAPSEAKRDMFREKPTDSHIGARSVAVPGELAGYEVAYELFGSGNVKWSALFKPVVKLNKDGFKINERFEEIIYRENLRPIMTKASWADIMAPQGILLRRGSILRNSRLAETLSTIAQKGAREFYTGELAARTVKYLKSNGGILTMKDLEKYKIEKRRVIEGQYGEYSYITASEPTSGRVSSAILSILDKKQLPARRDGVGMHRVVEAMKWGYSLRTRLGDPEFLNATQIAQLNDDQWITSACKHIDDNTTFPVSYYNPKFHIPDSHGTSHITVIDNEGNVVLLTTTINTKFGSLLRDPETGIVFNNEMDDFSTPNLPNQFGLAPSPANFIEPFKRPLSSTSHLLFFTNENSSITGTDTSKSTGKGTGKSTDKVTDQSTSKNARKEPNRGNQRRIHLALGASGGSLIISSTVLTAVNYLSWNMNSRDSVTSARVHNQLIPNTTLVEPWMPIGLIDELQMRNHNLTTATIIQNSNVIFVSRSRDNSFEALSDPRNFGVAAGY